MKHCHTYSVAFFLKGCNYGDGNGCNNAGKAYKLGTLPKVSFYTFKTVYFFFPFLFYFLSKIGVDGKKAETFLKKSCENFHCGLGCHNLSTLYLTGIQSNILENVSAPTFYAISSAVYLFQKKDIQKNFSEAFKYAALACDLGI
jgi:TPR repeat protein